MLKVICARIRPLPANPFSYLLSFCLIFVRLELKWWHIVIHSWNRGRYYIWMDIRYSQLKIESNKNWGRWEHSAKRSLLFPSLKAQSASLLILNRRCDKQILSEAFLLCSFSSKPCNPQTWHVFESGLRIKFEWDAYTDFFPFNIGIR